jgi:hypothetical protein
LQLSPAMSRLRSAFIVAVASLAVLVACTPKKKKQKAVAPVPQVVKPDPHVMTEPSPQLVRDIGRGEILMAEILDLEKGAYFAYYNGDLGSERRLCGDGLKTSAATIHALIAKLDREGYQLRCEGQTCYGVKGTQWRAVVGFRPAAAGGLALDGAMVFMHPDAGDVLDTRIDNANAQACGPTIHPLLDREDPGYCQELCARAETCLALKPLKADAAKCAALCSKNKDAYSVSYCDVAGKDCPTLIACVTAHKDLVP